jgi:tRNA(fMet)-specific endonuclease VapC
LALLLDTSAAVELIEEAPRSMRRAREADGLFLSAVSHVELLAGMVREDRAIFLTRLGKLLASAEELEFTGREVAAYGSIIAKSGFSRRLVIDRMIAATALANDLPLATLNARDFRNIDGLTIEDWSA